MLASLSGSITSFVGNHGLYAVFVLMAIDAVFPAASELVMVYAGALASGAFASQHVVLFGNDVTTPLWAYVAVCLAGTLGYLFGSDRRLVRSAGKVAGRWLERHGGWLPPRRLSGWPRPSAGSTAGRTGPFSSVGLSRLSARSSPIPAGVFRMPLGRYTVLTIPGSALWCLVFAGIGWAVGRELRELPPRFQLLETRTRGRAVALALYLVVRRRSKSD